MTTEPRTPARPVARPIAQPIARLIARPIVFGQTIDDETRCVHYSSAKDVIAIKFRCCLLYFPCHLCHAEVHATPVHDTPVHATPVHATEVWPLTERQQKAILCGVCAHELSIAEYLLVDGCPRCGAQFNEGCRLHAHYYFQL